MASENGTGTAGYTAERLEALAANRLTLDKSAVRSIHADEIEITKSAVAFARFDHGTIRQGSAGVVIGRSVAMDEVRTGILISPVVRGDVHTWLDMRSAVAIGFGMVMGKALLAAGRALVRRVRG
ncbi:MAG: hypothetical protein IPI85_04335 [Dehalococcoidia bacterium]|uniref:hypothetical protein n=1 Tax=Candidatus Amarobacter glycogenicus TaxID=3140699 RepID=UPI003134916E|nr:hypothetical protein [Dehalococcoidia bacterium]MBK8559582.1 hypothetical protein [Dehalococcoidia bacterium]